MTFEEFENLKSGNKVISNQLIKDDIIVEQGIKGIVSQIDHSIDIDDDEPNILVEFDYPVYSECWCFYYELNLN